MEQKTKGDKSEIECVLIKIDHCHLFSDQNFHFCVKCILGLLFSAKYCETFERCVLKKKKYGHV